MLPFLEGVAIIELNSPALFTVGTLNVMGACRLAIASCIHFSHSTAEAKLGLEVIGKRRVFEDLFSFVRG